MSAYEWLLVLAFLAAGGLVLVASVAFDPEAPPLNAAEVRSHRR